MRILRFNESSDELKNQLRERLIEIRDVFTDFEDMDIISYCVIPTGYQLLVNNNQFNPKKDFEKFLDQIVPIINIGLTPDDKLGGPGLTSKYNLIGSKHMDLSDKNICVICNIKIPGERDSTGNTVIDSEGIKIFEEILSANSRLIDMGYDIKLNLNSNHMDYKPVKFLIYFNI